MNVLGINSFVHDSSAALLADGTLVAAAEEERFSRRKHDARFPEAPIEYCLAAANCTLDEVDVVAFCDRPVVEILVRLPVVLRYFPRSLQLGRHAGAAIGEIRIARRLRVAYPFRRQPAWRYLNHHETHAASTFLTSPYERAAILGMDGSGTVAATWTGIGEGNRIRRLESNFYLHSLGFLYGAITQFLGFASMSDEYKVMGLASYGAPRYLEALRKLVALRPAGRYRLNLRYFRFQFGDPQWYDDRLTSLLGPARRSSDPLEERHADIAASVQCLLEEVVRRIAAVLHQRSGSSNLCIAGGVGLNAVMNGMLLREGPFENVFVTPSAGDGGTAYGSALYAHHVVLEEPRRDTAKMSPYLGPESSDTEIRASMQRHGLVGERLSEDALCRRIAAAVESGKVVAHFHGRMEVGPRALGNRSILADPRRSDMKDVLNERIKHREPFRPFAPTVLASRFGEFFEGNGASPYMTFVFAVRPDKRETIPAVTHVDGTARVQTLEQADNPRFHRILSEFERRTGVPILLNTSFNVQGEPIVCTAEDALGCFVGTEIDALAIGKWWVEKPGAR